MGWIESIPIQYLSFSILMVNVVAVILAAIALFVSVKTYLLARAKK